MVRDRHKQHGVDLSRSRPRAVARVRRVGSRPYEVAGASSGCHRDRQGADARGCQVPTVRAPSTGSSRSFSSQAEPGVAAYTSSVRGPRRAPDAHECEEEGVMTGRRHGRRWFAGVMAGGLLTVGLLPQTAHAAAESHNLALGRPVTASGAHGEYVATHVTDGNQASYWEGPARPCPMGLAERVLPSLSRPIWLCSAAPPVRERPPDGFARIRVRPRHPGDLFGGYRPGDGCQDGAEQWFRGAAGARAAPRCCPQAFQPPYGTVMSSMAWPAGSMKYTPCPPSL